jgi:thiosulfate reductase cytochrome b subunit
MTATASAAAPVVVRRHSLVVRITHWINALALILLIMSGLNIFNAHPALYLGDASTFSDPALAISARPGKDGEMVGVTQIGDVRLTTTGLLGVSSHKGRVENQAFPSWLTLPDYRDLATARHWHFFFAWLLVLNSLVYLAYGFGKRHVQRNLWVPVRDYRTIPHEIWAHARLRFPEGEAARTYNVLQKLTYLVVIFVLGPLIVLTGLSMSPGTNAVFGHVLPEMFGGRQSARTLHFVCAFLFVAFIIVHLVLVVLSGLFNNLRSMITGDYVLPQAKAPRTAPKTEAKP